MHVVEVMWSDWPQCVHPVGPGRRSGPMQDCVKVYTAQVGRWESVSLQFPKPLPIFACPSPVGHSSHPILPSIKTCQILLVNRIPPNVKGMLQRLRDRKTYRLLDFSAESFQYVSSFCKCSPRDLLSLPTSSRQSVGWSIYWDEQRIKYRRPCLEKWTPNRHIWGSCAGSLPTVSVRNHQALFSQDRTTARHRTGMSMPGYPMGISYLHFLSGFSLCVLFRNYADL